jgi:WD40 repeat protein
MVDFQITPTTEQQNQDSYAEPEATKPKSPRFSYDFAPASPMKKPRDIGFSHFSKRYRSLLSDSEVFSMRFNQDASLTAISFSNGSLQIISSMLGDRLYQVSDDTMKFPITNLAWRPTTEQTQDAQKLLGTCTDGHIIRWTSAMSNAVEKIELNPVNQYHTIDYANDGYRFVVAGTEPNIEIWDEPRMTRVQTIGDNVDKAHTNKIFTTKFHPAVSYMMWSGAWDRQVHFWDLRSNKLMNKIGGKV